MLNPLRLATILLGLFILGPAVSATVVVVPAPTPNAIQTAIQTAVNNAAAPGAKKTVVIHSGPYSETILIQGIDNLHLIGAEANVLGSTSGNGVGIATPSSTNAAIIDGAGISGSCITIIDSNQITISGLEVANCEDAGILSFSSSGQALRDNTVIQNYIHDVIGGPCVWMDTTIRSEVTGNWIESCGSTGIGISLFGKHSLLSDNFIDGFIGTGIETGIRLSGGGENQVAFNKIDTLAWGIVDQSTSTCTLRNKVSPNIDTSGSTDAQVIGNQIANYPNGLIGPTAYDLENF